MCVSCNTEMHSRNHFCHTKTFSISYSQRESVCVREWERACSLNSPACKAHAPFYIVICGLSGSTVLSSLSHKRHDFEENVIGRKIWILISWQPHFKKNSARYYVNVFCIAPTILVYFNRTGFSEQLFEKKWAQMSNFIKIRPVGAELFHADGQTEGRSQWHDEANSRFSQFRGRSAVMSH
jgi:hypothetical protein